MFRVSFLLSLFCICPACHSLDRKDMTALKALSVQPQCKVPGFGQNLSSGLRNQKNSRKLSAGKHILEVVFFPPIRLPPLTFSSPQRDVLCILPRCLVSFNGRYRVDSAVTLSLQTLGAVCLRVWSVLIKRQQPRSQLFPQLPHFLNHALQTRIRILDVSSNFILTATLRCRHPHFRFTDLFEVTQLITDGPGFQLRCVDAFLVSGIQTLYKCSPLGLLFSSLLQKRNRLREATTRVRIPTTDLKAQLHVSSVQLDMQKGAQQILIAKRGFSEGKTYLGTKDLFWLSGKTGLMFATPAA